MNNYTETNLYRFGCPGIAWLGSAYQVEFTPYEASSPREAWRIGQKRWLHPGADERSSGEYIVVLERKVLAPAVLRLSGDDVTLNRADRTPHQELWVRVAVGEADHGWPGDRNGGIFRYESNPQGQIKQHINILDPDLDLHAALLPLLNHEDLHLWADLRERVKVAIEKKQSDRHKYPKKDTPLWVILPISRGGVSAQVEMLFEEDNFIRLCAALDAAQPPTAD